MRILPKPARFTVHEYRALLTAYPDLERLLEEYSPIEDGEALPVVKKVDGEVFVYLGLLTAEQLQHIQKTFPGAVQAIEKQLRKAGKKRPLPRSLAAFLAFLGIIVAALLAIRLMGGLAILQAWLQPPAPTPTAVASPVELPTEKPTSPPTMTPTTKPLPTVTPVPTMTPTAPPAPKVTATPTMAPTLTPTPKARATATPKPTATPTIALKVTPTPMPRSTATPKPTATPTIAPKVTPTSEVTSAPTPKVTPTGTPNKPTPMPTSKAIITPSITPELPPPPSLQEVNLKQNGFFIPPHPQDGYYHINPGETISIEIVLQGGASGGLDIEYSARHGNIQKTGGGNAQYIAPNTSGTIDRVTITIIDVMTNKKIIQHVLTLQTTH